ncbi:hypothetical protein D6C89_08374 [Aureobasidium pullulans]|uniref:Uncharacterized protein n=1 Tax=Aureobasidium pullulans TaxID=5580 RepID=A0A4S8VMV9_AURPU|nr:hypothetical protein D6D24_06592 [Aureobasidium pullulans]THZ18252.1 hypothetical protein D6C89_08374 [Aureobasidium pullulans]
MSKRGLPASPTTTYGHHDYAKRPRSNSVSSSPVEPRLAVGNVRSPADVEEHDEVDDAEADNDGPPLEQSDNAPEYEHSSRDSRNSVTSGGEPGLNQTNQEDALVARPSLPVPGQVVQDLPFDWPSKSHGVIDGICDFKALKRFMTSEHITEDHKAMWVSLAQTIVHEPDQACVLNFLQDLLQGTSVLVDNAEKASGKSGDPLVTQETWAVTKYLQKVVTTRITRRSLSAAHFVELALWYGGIEAGRQAAEAIRVFGLWNPHGDGTLYGPPSMAIELTHIQILNKIWPSSPLDEKVMLDWANETRGPIDPPFTEFKDAHQYLLRECIGSDLSCFPSSARNVYTKRKIPDRIISKARFDSTLAPLLVEHFDAGVDLQLAYQAVVKNQGKSVDHVECEYVNPVRLATNQKGLKPNGVGNKGKCFDEDDHQDDEEFFGRPQTPLLRLGFPSGDNLNTPEIKREPRDDSVVSTIASAVRSFEDPVDPSTNKEPASTNARTNSPISTRVSCSGRIKASCSSSTINKARDKGKKSPRTLATTEDDDEDLNRRGLFITQQPLIEAATPHTSTLSTTIPQPLPISSLDAHTINQLYERSRSISERQISTLIEKRRPQLIWCWTQVLHSRHEPGALSPDFVPFRDVPLEETNGRIPGVLRNAHIQRDKDIESDMVKLQRPPRYPLRSTTQHLQPYLSSPTGK